MGIQLTLQRYDVQILGRTLQFTGQMEPIGRVLDFFNQENRTTFPLYDVKISPLTPGNPLAGVVQSEIIASDRELGLVYFLDAEYRQKVDLLKNADRVIAYTPHAILRGNFHRGAEARLADLFDLMSGAFLAMTDVSVFPLINLPAPFPEQTDLLIVNRFYIDLFHLE